VEIIYDAGALIAAERGSGAMAHLHAEALRGEALPVVPAAVLGQVWRGRPRQARLSRLLAGCQIVPLDEHLAREGGVLCGLAGTADIVDAVVVVLALHLGAGVVTADRGDFEHLSMAAGTRLHLFDI
jgi:predicted nucleic acid-binding protein